MLDTQSLNEFQANPWAILPQYYQALLRAVVSWSVPAEPAAARPAQASRQSGAVAVLQLAGPIFPRGSALDDLFGPVASAERFALTMRQAAADPAVGAIVLDIHSPGGSVAGIPEAVAAVRDANAQKPVVAAANHLAASAAYWIASAAREIIVTPAGEVGSIGVFAAHQDISQALDKAGVKVSLISAGKHKTEGNPYEPLTDEARESIQARVNEFYGMFVADVARGRKTSADTVRETFGEGRMVGAKQAVSLGMADGVGDLGDAIRRAGRLAGQAAQAVTAAEAAPAIQAETPPDAELDFRLRRARAIRG